MTPKNNGNIFGRRRDENFVNCAVLSYSPDDRMLEFI
jgi:hypothetical protein